VAAYGDSAKDFEAYIKAGIPKERIFALQRAEEKTCQGDPSMWNKCLQSWTEHMNEISAELVAKWLIKVAEDRLSKVE